MSSNPKQVGKAVGKNPVDQREHATRARGVNLIAELKTGRDVTRAVTKWDRYQAGHEATAGGAFAKGLHAHDRSPAWAAFARETYARLYDSGTGRDLTDEERPLGSEWVAKLHDTAESLPEWKALRERSRRDPWACGIAAGEAMTVLAQQVQPPETDPQAVQDELEFIRQLMAESGNKTSSKHLKRMAALKRQVVDAQQEHARAIQLLDAKSAAIRSALRGAIQAANAKIEEYDDAMSALGAGDGAGVASRVQCPPAEIRSTLARNDKLRRILRRAGRMKSAAIAKQRTKARPGAEELCDVKLGSDVSRLVPSELMGLATEDTEALLYRKLLEGTAMSYELRGREHRSEGPIILAVDESGSMQGEPDEWAKSVAMAIMEIAARQNRSFAYLHFNTGVTRTDLVEKPRELDLKQLEELATYFTGGGTYIGAALGAAATMLEEAQRARGDTPWKRADVILVTDGVSGDVEAQTKAIERIRAVGGHLYSFFIGCQPGDPCATMADEKMMITHQDIKANDPQKLGTIFSI